MALSPTPAYPPRPTLRQELPYGSDAASSSGAATHPWRSPAAHAGLAPSDVPYDIPRQRRPSVYRNTETMLVSPRLEAPAEMAGHGPGPVPYSFRMPIWSPIAEQPPRARSRAFPGVLGYNPDFQDVHNAAHAPMEPQNSLSELLPHPVQTGAQKRRPSKNFWQRAVTELNGQWRPDLLLALSAAGRVCYGFGPIAIEQQIDLSPLTGAQNSTATYTAAGAVATAFVNGTGSWQNATGSINGTYEGHFGERQGVPVNFSGWTIAIALLGIGLGATGALGLFLDGLKFKRKLAVFFFTLHLIGIGLVTCGHIINDELSRKLPVGFRIFAALPGALGSGLHLMTIPVSYSASKYLRKGPTTKSAAANNMLLLAPLRCFAGTVIPVWGFSQIYPVNPYVRDTLSIVGNVALIYAFALPMVDLRAWIGGAPERREISDEERLQREILGRAAMGLMEVPRRRLHAIVDELELGDDVPGETYALDEFLPRQAEEDWALPSTSFAQQRELKRVHSI